MPRKARNAEPMAETWDESETWAKEFVSNADDEIVACRATGHGWPKLKPGKVSKYIRVRAAELGCFELTQICRDCGMIRRLITLPGGEIDFPARYHYVQPEGYKAPKGAHVTPRMCMREAWRRLRESDAYITETTDK